MKKLLFVLTFAFIGQQAFSQMYIATLVGYSHFSTAGCNSSEIVLVKVDPTGNQTTACIQNEVGNGGLITLNQELNSILSQGYQLIETSYSQSNTSVWSGGGLIHGGFLRTGTAFIFAIP